MEYTKFLGRIKLPKNETVQDAYLHKIIFPKEEFSYFLFPGIIEGINKETLLESLEFNNSILTLDFSLRDPFDKENIIPNRTFFFMFNNNSSMVLGEKLSHLGLLVVDKVVEDIQEEGYTSIELCSIDKNNKKLKEYYNKMFEKWGGVKYYYKKGYKKGKNKFEEIKFLNGIINLI